MRNAPSAFNFGEAKREFGLEFNKVGLGMKSNQISKQLPEIGGMQLAGCTLRSYWRVSGRLISSHQ
ncbi:MAG: hypothetical protein ACI85I_001701 [Arenicella sp.]|jgi:hypothetical protein